MATINTKNNRKRRISVDVLLSSSTVFYPLPPKSSKTSSDNILLPSTSSVSINTIEDQLVLDTPENSNENSVEMLATPDKSERDKKSYRIIRLANGLTALLISDPSPLPEKIQPNVTAPQVEASSSTDSSDIGFDDDYEDDNDDADFEDGYKEEKLAACSLCVDVGSSSDPRHVQGLAHFLEHMIFMGSQKYPKENDFDQYIKKCGGFNNADTNTEETVFYFEIPEQYLPEAFDRFTNLFINPLMLKESMTREREAVNSEFLSKKQDDDARREQLIASLVNENHPSSLFTWGNLITLKDNISDDELHKEVHEFRNRHYSAHRMFACIQARLPLDKLQELSVKYFANIPSNNKPGLDFTKFIENWKTDTFKKIWSDKLFVVKPVLNVMKIDFRFFLKPVIKDYKTKPHDYVSYLIYREGKGTLSYYLRHKLWAVNILAGIEEIGFSNNSLYSLLTVTIYLTQEGYRHIPKVVEATFSYLRFIEKCGPLPDIFNELQQIEANNFRFQVERNAMENVLEIPNLKYYPPKDILTASTLYFEYNPEQISSMLEYINNSFMNIMITSKIPFNGNQFDLCEKWFGTKYCMIDYPKEWYDMWNNVQPFDEFQLPKSNPFVTTDFTLINKNDNEEAGATLNLYKYPEQIMETDIYELWYRKDDRFLLPNVYCYFYFQSPLAKLSQKNAIMMTLYNLLIEFKLTDAVFPAIVAGFEYNCYRSEKGITLKINGFSQHISRLIEIFAQRLIGLGNDITESEFKLFMEQQLRIYYNIIIKPCELAKTLRLAMINKSFCPIIEKFNMIKEITFDDFKDFIQQFTNQMRIQALFQGNLSAEQSIEIMNNLVTTLKCSKIENPNIMNIFANKLPIGTTNVRVKTMNPQDVNTITVNYYQMGPITIKLNCFIDLLMLIAEEPLFKCLRTQEQLGYDVSCSMRDSYGALGYTIIVNSQENLHTAEYIDQRIEKFRNDQINVMQQMLPEDFEQFKESLIKLKSMEDNDLNDEVCRNWSEIATNEYLFNRSKREINMIKTITHKEFMEFYLNYYYNNHRKLMVQVIGNAIVPEPDNAVSDMVLSGDIFDYKFPEIEIVPFMQPQNGSTLVENFNEFRNNLEQYPVLKTDLSEPIKLHSPTTSSPSIEPSENDVPS